MKASRQMRSYPSESPSRKLRSSSVSANRCATPRWPLPPSTAGSAQARAGVEPEEGAAADRIPLRRERRRLPDHLQVAPNFSQTTLGLERGAATVAEHQVHRLARGITRMHRGEPATRP